MATYGSSDVHYYYSTMSGAPTLSGESGKLIGVLDACLIDGFGSEAAQGGWEKAFSGTNKAVYQSTSVRGTRLFLRVDDTPAQYPKISIYEDMTDIDTGTVLTPNTDISPTYPNVYLSKSDAASSASKAWRVFADSQAVYVIVQNFSTWWSGQLFMGDIVNAIPGDRYHCLLIGHQTENATSASLQSFDGTATNAFFAKSAHGKRGTYGGRYGLSRAGSSGNLGDYYPSRVRGGLVLAESDAWDNTGQALYTNQPAVYRGRLPGLYYLAHSNPYLVDATVIPNVSELGAGARSIYIQGLGNGAQSVAMDLTGPWRA